MRATMWRAGKWAFDQLGNALLQPPERTCFGRVQCHGGRDRRRVALTFDDGPSRPSTPLLLDTLGELDVRATFFCVGEMVMWHPDVVERAAQEGHEIGNHSMYHSRRQSLAVTGSGHIDAAQDAIEGAIGRRPALYRPAWGWTAPWEHRRARDLGMTIVGWDVYPDDWRIPENPAASTTRQVLDAVQPGSIILLHDATSGVRDCAKTETASAVRQIVRALRDQDFEIVSASEMLGVAPYVEHVTSAA